MNISNNSSMNLLNSVVLTSSPIIVSLYQIHSLSPPVSSRADRKRLEGRGEGNLRPNPTSGIGRGTPRVRQREGNSVPSRRRHSLPTNVRARTESYNNSQPCRCTVLYCILYHVIVSRSKRATHKPCYLLLVVYCD